MNLWEKFLGNESLRRMVVLIGLAAILYLSKSMLSIILLTFIFTFLIVRLIESVQQYIKIPSKLIVLAVYIFLIAVMYLAITVYVPVLLEQSETMIKSVLHFYQHPPKGTSEIVQYINDYIGKSDIVKQLKNGVSIVLNYVTSLGSMGFTFVMSLLLSFFFTIEKDEMATFSKCFLKGPYAWLFNDIYYFAKIFVNTFGVVLEAQFMIALVNTLLTTICLALLHMPQLISLAVMIFILSLVPVAGVIISAVPMSFIAYSDGGVRLVIYVLVMLLVIHALESYVLNPKFMASRTELPIFYTFVVLLVAEHLFGVWGLIVGIPIFTFALDVLGIKPVNAKKKITKFRKKDSNG